MIALRDTIASCGEGEEVVGPGLSWRLGAGPGGCGAVMGGLVVTGGASGG